MSYPPEPKIFPRLIIGAIRRKIKAGGARGKKEWLTRMEFVLLCKIANGSTAPRALTIEGERHGAAEMPDLRE
jgi:hypothetical protein